MNGATSYRLYRTLSSGAQGTTPYKTGVTQATFTDIGLSNGTNYFYRVTAVSAAGEGPRSAEVSARPAASPGGNVTVSGRVASGTNAWWGEVD